MDRLQLYSEQNSNSANFQETEDDRSAVTAGLAVNSHFVLWCLGFLHRPCGT